MQDSITWIKSHQNHDVIGIIDLQVRNMLKTVNLLKQLVKYASHNFGICWNTRQNGTGRKI